MPRENAILHLLLRMLALGLSAWSMIESQEFAEPRLDTKLVTHFIPGLMSLIVDDHVRSVDARMPPEERDSAHIIIEHSGPPPEAFQVFVDENPVAAALAMQYALQVTRSRDRTGTMRVLGTLAAAVRGHPFEDAFMHCLVTNLISMATEFEEEDFCTVLFDGFFYSNIASDNFVRHLLRYAY